MKHVGVWSKNGSASNLRDDSEMHFCVSLSPVKHCVTVGTALSRLMKNSDSMKIRVYVCIFWL